MKQTKRRQLFPLILLGVLIAAPFLNSQQRAASAPVGCSVSGEAFGVYGYVGETISLSKVAGVVLAPGGTSSIGSVSALPLVTSGAIADDASDDSTIATARATARSTVNS